MITGKLYDQLKFLAQILLPALGTLYFTIAGIWSLPSAEEVVGTIIAVDTFLGVLLGISQSNYNKAIEHGEVVIAEETGQVVFRSNNDTEIDLDELGDKQEVRFKVKKVNGGSKTTSAPE